MGLNIESDSEERAFARVSKDGHKRDRASGHPSRRRFAPPQDEVCRFKLHPPDPIAKSPHDLGIAFDRQQQCASRRIGRASVLLPIAQSGDGQVKRFSKLRLRHSETLPEYFDARYPAPL